jgi:ATP-dependent Clp protease ATP-binding subunit ClpC
MRFFGMLKVDARTLAERLDGILRGKPKEDSVEAEPGQTFITPRVVQIIQLANEEANQMKDEHISTEHMFLAILSERDTPTAQLLEGAGVNRDRVIAALQQLRGGSA